jgi:hypothetical protein
MTKHYVFFWQFFWEHTRFVMSRSTRRRKPWTKLRHAAQAGSPDVFIQYIQMHVDRSIPQYVRMAPSIPNVESVFPDKISLLETAIAANNVDVVKCLRKLGVGLVNQETSASAFCHAAALGNVEMLEALDCKDIDARNMSDKPWAVDRHGLDGYDCTALMIAAGCGHLSSVMWLVEHKADINAQNAMCNFYTPLYYAIRGDNASVLPFLIPDHGARCAHWVFKGQRGILSPVSFAIQLGSVALLPLLIGLESPVEILWRVALTSKQPEALKWLIRNDSVLTKVATVRDDLVREALESHPDMLRVLILAGVHSPQFRSTYDPYRRHELVKSLTRARLHYFSCLFPRVIAKIICSFIASFDEVVVVLAW